MQTLDEFVMATREQAGDDAFLCQSAQTVRLSVDGRVWLKPGTVIAHRGALAFERVPTLGASSAKDAALREAAPIVSVRGAGHIWCASDNSQVHVVRLAGDSVVVAWRNLVAIEAPLTFGLSLLGRGVGIAAGGLVVATICGHGRVAFSTHGHPLTLAVTPDSPVSTEMNATVAWTPSLTLALERHLSWKSPLGHGGQSAFQIRFEGAGCAVVQPSRDSALRGPVASAWKVFKALVKP